MKNKVAWIDDIRLLTVRLEGIDLLETEEVPVIYWKKRGKYFPVKIDKIIDDSTVSMTFSEELPMGEILVLLWGKRKIPVYPRAIVRTEWFENHYSDLNAKLGADYQESATTFSVWAPTAISVKVCLNQKVFTLSREKSGIWKRKIVGEWHGFTYQYEVTVNGTTTYANDPYAKAMLANSTKSVIVDLSKTDPADFTNVERPKLQNLQDAIIYELHVRDATIQANSGVVNKGKFSGLAEAATTTLNSYSTGLSYLKELGITHVQLLPINDFARVNELDSDSDYNWGYDPLYFQVPEGSYSTDPEDPLARIKECKEMIKKFHQEGISVILDVVYNHVFIMEESPFEKIVPGYYFRYHTDGSLSNGTGVGNDLATERRMVRKFIIDTINFWLQEYKVDGFRFDLMGAIDIETMKNVHERCSKEAVPIMLLGEGWELPTVLAPEDKATAINSQQLSGIRFFNDYFRDSLKGNQFDTNSAGYVNGLGHFIERLPNLISGSALETYGEPFVSEVNQTINYVECHDNHTLWDRLSLTNGDKNAWTRKKMHQLASGITLLSQGVPFIHAGQEWFRSKQGDENSYISGDQINQLDWYQRESENENIVFIKSLIALRKKYKVFRLSSKQEIRKRFKVLTTPSTLFGFALLGEDEDLSIYVNPTEERHRLHLPSSGKWQIAVTNDAQKQQAMEEVIGEYTCIESYELLVLRRSIKS
ncbi:type I pullulanase [Virgibacillus necropolis]|uniref:Type I pullulanase n=1 Tax=Virgibacillus necropolis TaxID=163877 RepID=A0A221MGE1_9BACI|nr:type I pullulanase [Virgibacillus necropolis]ASN06728.1 type I pullulanase [Virgibacillus necropolis]